MKVVILAGGRGTRLSEETDRIPKPMVRIGDKPILWHIMKYYSSFGLKEFVICLGYKGYVIKEYFLNYRAHVSDLTVDLGSGAVDFRSSNAEDWKVHLIETGEDSNTGGRLRRIRDLVSDGPFCFTYGDGVSTVAVDKQIAFHKAHGRKVTVTAVVPPGRYGVLTTQASQVVRFGEKDDQLGTLINGGFFIMEPSALDFIEGDQTSWEYDSLPQVVAANELMAFEHAGFWYAMDTLRDKNHLEELWEQGKAPWKTWK